MNALESLDQQLRETEIIARKNFLIRQLRILGLELAPDGRKLEDVSLYTLEWTYIDMRNEVSRAYGEVVQ